jgi:anaerobic C4-dicarboxylate transporter
MAGNIGHHLIMNLILRPLNDVNDVTWSVIICLITLLCGTGYYIYTIIDIANKEMSNGTDDTPES